MSHCDRKRRRLDQRRFVSDNEDDAAAVLHERHNPVDQLPAILHIGFAEFKKAQIKFSVQLRESFGRSFAGTGGNAADAFARHCQRAPR